MINKKGQITIIAKNMNIKAMNKIRDDAGIIKNTAGKRFIQKGNEGIVHGKNISPKDDLRVMKIDGPFSQQTKEKVDKIEKGKVYSFKVIEYSRTPQTDELKKLMWIVKYSDFMFPALDAMGKDTLFLKIGKDINIKKIQIYAYFKKLIDRVSVELCLCGCICCGNYNISIKGINTIKSYTGDFPSPLQIMNYTPSKKDPLMDFVYISDSRIRGWIKDAANYHGIPHEIIAVIIQQENKPHSSKTGQFLQFGERTLTTTAAIMDRSLGDIIPDRISDGSSGFMNMRRPTLYSTIEYMKKNYCKELMPVDVAYRIGYLFDSNVDVGIQGLDWRADLYYGAAHIRQLIDGIVGKCSNGEMTLEQVEQVFTKYNGSKAYGKSGIELLKKASQGKAILYFYEK